MNKRTGNLQFRVNDFFSSTGYVVSKMHSLPNTVNMLSCLRSWLSNNIWV